MHYLNTKSPTVVTVSAVLLCWIIPAAGKADTTIRVASYNIKFLDADKLPDQGQRTDNLKAVVAELDADVIGLQEIDDRAALEAIFDPAVWTLLIDDDSGNAQDLAAAVRKTALDVIDFSPDLDADDTDFLFPSAADNDPFPNRRDVLVVRLHVRDENANFVLLVNHAKARVGGRLNTTPRRQLAAQMLVSEIETRFDGQDVVVVGDFNDSPDDSSLNILESGDPSAQAEMEDLPGPFLTNLIEPLWAQGRLTHGFKKGHVTGGKLLPIDPLARNRDFGLRHSNASPNAAALRTTLDHILVSPTLLDKLAPGSNNIFDGITAVNGTKKEWPSDHLPVYADFTFGAAAPTQPSVKIIALLPNPVGPDAGNETVTLRNESTTAVGLDGWKLRDLANHEFALSGNIDAGSTLTITLPANVVPLNNGGDTVCLLAPGGLEHHRVEYKRSDVDNGVAVTFD